MPAAFDPQGVRSHSPLDIERMKRGLNIAQIALDLDEEQGAAIRMPGRDVHRTAVAVVVERVLGRRLPTQADQPPNHCLDKRGVSPIDLSLDGRAASRSGFEGKLDPGGASHCPGRRDVHLGEMAAFESRDGTSAHPCSCSQVRLPQAESAPLRANPGADPQVVHAASVAGGDQPAISGLTAPVREAPRATYGASALNRARGGLRDARPPGEAGRSKPGARRDPARRPPPAIRPPRSRPAA